jgi:carotenoid cleavage dioxygenase-like enzyme
MIVIVGICRADVHDCEVTGKIVAFGYVADGFGSKTVSVFEYTSQGKLVWNAKVQVPSVGKLHDFAVTEKHIGWYVHPARDGPEADGRRRPPCVPGQHAADVFRVRASRR